MPTDATTYRLEVTVATDDHEVVSAWLFTAGALGVVTAKDTVTAWFPTPAFAPSPLPIPEALRAVTTDMFTPEEAHDWHAAWVATIQPVQVGRFFIIPGWLVADGVVPADTIQLIVDPAQAFGSGHHATTGMCLELIDHAATAHPARPWRVADVGCGTGVLAIAAAKLGADVDAVDTDPMAIRVTDSNATINQVTVRTRVGSVDTLPTRPHTLVANLLSDTIIALADELAAAPTNDLIVSGISTERFPDVTHRLQPLLGAPHNVLHREGWVAARFVTERHS